jgi:hypothetical protein
LITQLPRQVPISDTKGLMAEVFFNWMLNVTNLSTIVGEGSPENVIEARQSRFYLQTDGAARSILWVKKLNDISGNRTRGWELV